jgi:hypothetical protein
MRRGGGEEEDWSCLLLIHVRRLRRGDEEEEHWSCRASLSPPLSLSCQSCHPIS